MNIILEIAKTCDRQDCRFVMDDFGISNSAGYTSGVTCRTCKREWSVYTPSRWDQEVYDRNGDLTNPYEAQIKITEITKKVK